MRHDQSGRFVPQAKECGKGLSKRWGLGDKSAHHGWFGLAFRASAEAGCEWGCLLSGFCRLFAVLSRPKPWFALSGEAQNHKESAMAPSSPPQESAPTAPRRDAKTLAAERLAKALRENLKRRKQLARARAQQGRASGAEPADAPEAQADTQGDL